MPHSAILVGNLTYSNLTDLDCCREDLLAMRELLDATGNYDTITTVENVDSDDLKSQIRAAIDDKKSIESLFFYFTGHGYHSQEDFFYCATKFDTRRPNESGLSTTELHTLLRLANAELVVKVVDACNSGTLLVKTEQGVFSRDKDGFRNLIQIASCLDTQNSLTGNPLSLFTDKFIEAAIRKEHGVVYYTDIISTLHDEFIENNQQTPFFVSQQTGREQFVDDGQRLEKLRQDRRRIRSSTVGVIQPVTESSPADISSLDKLRALETKFVTAEILEKFVGNLFDSLNTELTRNSFADFFEVNVVEHSAFMEPSAEKFIIRVLSNEKRSDNFVDASRSRKFRPSGSAINAIMSLQGIYDNLSEENWSLKLNCTMARAQLKVTLTPKFMSLKRIILVLSCAPSLEHCYVFETITQHALCDFGKYDDDGAEISRRWWKLSWSEKSDAVVAKVVGKLFEAVNAQLA